MPGRIPTVQLGSTKNCFTTIQNIYCTCTALVTEGNKNDCLPTHVTDNAKPFNDADMQTCSLTSIEPIRQPCSQVAMHVVKGLVAAATLFIYFVFFIHS